MYKSSHSTHSVYVIPVSTNSSCKITTASTQSLLKTSGQSGNPLPRSLMHSRCPSAGDIVVRQRSTVSCFRVSLCCRLLDQESWSVLDQDLQSPGSGAQASWSSTCPVPELGHKVRGATGWLNSTAMSREHPLAKDKARGVTASLQSRQAHSQPNTNSNHNYHDRGSDYNDSSLKSKVHGGKGCTRLT